MQPDDADDKSVTWTSSNESVATVTDGTVTAIAAGTAEITASCSGLSDVCTVTVIEELKEPEVGDFYYSDGTWSASLNTSKTVIGIIFWTGNPAGDDTILGSDYPDCTHGLVVSIEQLEGKWQSGASKYGQLIDTWVQSNLSGYESMLAGYGYLDGEMLNFMLGYQYTKAIKAFNDAPENAEWPVDIVAGIAAFNESCPAPEGTSGWYLILFNTYLRQRQPAERNYSPDFRCSDHKRLLVDKFRSRTIQRDERILHRCLRCRILEQS